MSTSNQPHRGNKTLLSESSAFFTNTDRDNRPTLDGTQGGQYGFAPDSYAYVSEHPHIDQQGWCFVMSTPSVFSRLPAGNYLHALTKAWFETRARTWQGPTDRTELEFGDVRWSGRTLSVPTGGTRTLGPISFQGNDVAGEVFTNLHSIWVKWAGHDTDIGAPRAVVLDDPGDLLIDERSATLLMFNTTENMRDIAHAAITMAVMPRSTVEVGIRRNKDEAGQIREINQEYTGLTEFDTLAVREVARTFLKKLPLYNNIGASIPAGFKDRTAVLESLRDVGIMEQMKDRASQVKNKNAMV
ncbi:virion structural protein [Vibrio phage Aphrodite1]|uniref:Tail tube protein n=3 Tax=Aphroditevirus TaxID=2560092 RepID=A0A514A2S6_9CAUD|nr:virion structural protein [Vibrio phage Aphrodite1]YP_009847901.1 virion structural protein [Vibrio phage USC-1]AUR80993.1 putative tail tube protein [Vibrio phage Aphrodite1]QCW23170.1 hypothetical protein [Vibrio phage 5 TSL-2019]QDH47559.1 hypothetical protein [Vibrio phage USC-1]